MKQRILLSWLCGGFAALTQIMIAAPLDSSFMYQGKLLEDGQPANGILELRLTLYDSSEGGNAVEASVIQTNLAVHNGTFSATMDFGQTSFTGDARWLEIQLRPGGSEEQFVTLSPRQPLLAIPYALHAVEAGTVTDGVLTGEKLQDGQVVRSLNGMTDHVELLAGDNISVTQLGNELTVSAVVAEGPQGPAGPEGPAGPQGPPGQPGDSMWSLNNTSISYVGGRVGVGTTEPATLLHAQGSPVPNRGQLSLSAPAGQDMILSLYDAESFSAYLWYDPLTQDLRLQNVKAGDLNLNPYGGNVGIGSNNPGTKLHVAGAVAIGNTPDTTPPAGTIRWNGTDFEGYTGSNWLSLSGGGSTDAWSLTGNVGTKPTENFLGTIDDQPLELRVGGNRGLLLEASPQSGGFVNVVTGHESNRIHTRINTSGGYVDTTPSEVLGSVIAGGANNTITSDSRNLDQEDGWFDEMPNALSSISGGSHNRIDGSPGSVIGGGVSNTVAATYGYYLPGNYRLESQVNTISGGYYNFANGSVGAVISGGGGNSIVGISSEDIVSEWCTISGGRSNLVSGVMCSIGGGSSNRIHSYPFPIGTAVISGGSRNSIIGSTEAGGGYGSTISGGVDNVISASQSAAVIAGGINNQSSSSYSSILGGASNFVLGDGGVILGGLSNIVQGKLALAAGCRAVALHDGAFVWGDSTDADVESSTANEFTARASGGVRFFSSADLSTGVTLAAGDGSWASVSDRNAKQDFEPVDGVAVLEKVAALPLSTWSYKAQDSSIRHIGPMAQDFHAAFRLGADDKRITSIDADGVALAAIQGLNQKLTEKELEIADLKQRLNAIEGLVARLAESRH